MMNFKSMHCWNPICKGFMLSHFGRVCCVGQHRGMIHTIVRKSLVKYCKTRSKRGPRQERVNMVSFVSIFWYNLNGFLNVENVQQFFFVSRQKGSRWPPGSGEWPSTKFVRQPTVKTASCWVRVRRVYLYVRRVSGLSLQVIGKVSARID